MIDLVAVAYQAPAETQRMLESLQHISVPHTLTVVENNSPDPAVRQLLADWIKDAPAGYQVLLSDLNLGYARAINLGALVGDAPYLAALNCDIRFEPGCVEQVLEYFDTHPDVAVVGPRTTDGFGRLTHAGITNDGVRDQHRAWLQPDHPGVHDVLDVPTVSGATYFMRRSVWTDLTACPEYREVAPEATGAFLPTKHFYEETWFSYHARAHGHRVVYLGTAHMIHEWHRSSPVGSITLNEAEQYFRRACAAHDLELTW